MKKRKIMTIFLALMLVISLITTLVACKEPEPTPPAPTPPVVEDTVSVAGVADLIVDSWSKKYGYAANSDLAWDFSTAIKLNNDTYTISTLGNVSRTVAADNKFKVEIKKGEETIFSAAADDDNLYFDYGTAKYRYVKFDYAEMMMSDTSSGADNFDTVKNYIGMGIFLIFDQASKEGDNYTLSTDAKEMVVRIAELASTIGINIPLVDQLASLIPDGTTISLVANISGVDTFNSMMLKVDSDDDLEVNLSKAELSNTHAEFNVPSKTDDSFIETQFLNYTLKGNFDLMERTGNYTEMATSMQWELRLDINPFDVMRNGLFKSDSSMFHFRVYHQCNQDCGTFCNSKMSPSEGAIIDIAYDPVNFNNKINLAINTRYIINPELIDSLNIGMNIDSLLADYLGANINPEVITTMIDDLMGELLGGILGGEDEADIAEQSAATDAIGVIAGLDFNPIKLILNILNIASSIETTDNSVEFSVESILDTVAMFDPAMAVIIEYFFTGISTAKITVNDVIHADSENMSYNAFEQFMIVSPELAKTKTFETSENAYKLSKEIIDFDRDKNGNIRLNGDGVYDNNGNILPLSIEEVKSLLGGSVGYEYIDVYGEVLTANVPIVDVKGIDWDSREEQEITLILGLTDGHSLGYLLQLISAMNLFEIPQIPGDVVTTKIKITDVKSVNFYQPEGTTNPFDAEKEYIFRSDKINTRFNVEVTYDAKDADGNDIKKVKEGIQPNMVGSYIYSYGSADGGEIQYYDDFSLEYEAFGKSHKIDVNMSDDMTVTYDMNNIAGDITLGIGQKFTVANRQTVVRKAEGISDNSTNYYLQRTLYTIDAQDNLTIVNNTNTFDLTFSKAGTYDVTGTISGHKFTKRFIVETSVADLPGYNFKAAPIDGEMFEIKVERPNQLGNGLNISFNVSVRVGDELVAVAADKFEVYEKNYKGELIKIDSIVNLAKVIPGGKSIFIKIIDENLVAESVDDLKGSIEIVASDFNLAYTTVLADYNKYENLGMTINSELGSYASVDSLGQLAPTINGQLVAGIILGMRVTIKSEGIETVLDNSQYELAIPFEFWGQSLSHIEFSDIFSHRLVYVHILDASINTAGIQYKVELLDTAKDNKVILTASQY